LQETRQADSCKNRVDKSGSGWKVMQNSIRGCFMQTEKLMKAFAGGYDWINDFQNVKVPSGTKDPCGWPPRLPSLRDF
jgi:hypothetical protein